MGLRKTRPTDASSVLKVPSVHIIEGIDVEIVARDEPNCSNRGERRPKQEDVAGRDFACEPAHKSALELVVIAFWAPRASITRTKQGNAVLQKDVGI